MKVSESGYYDWRGRLELEEKAEEKRLRKAVRECFYEHRRRYGSRRIAEELKERGVSIGRYKVRRLM